LEEDTAAECLVLNGEVVLAGDAAPEDGAHLEEALLLAAADGGDAALAVRDDGNDGAQLRVGRRQRRRHRRHLQDRARHRRRHQLRRLGRRLRVAGALHRRQAQELGWAPDAGLLRDRGVGGAVGGHFLWELELELEVGGGDEGMDAWGGVLAVGDGGGRSGFGFWLLTSRREERWWTMGSCEEDGARTGRSLYRLRRGPSLTDCTRYHCQATVHFGAALHIQLSFSPDPPGVAHRMTEEHSAPNSDDILECGIQSPTEEVCDRAVVVVVVVVVVAAAAQPIPHSTAQALPPMSEEGTKSCRRRWWRHHQSDISIVRALILPSTLLRDGQYLIHGAP